MPTHFLPGIRANMTAAASAKALNGRSVPVWLDGRFALRGAPEYKGRVHLTILPTGEPTMKCVVVLVAVVLLASAAQAQAPDIDVQRPVSMSRVSGGGDDIGSLIPMIPVTFDWTIVNTGTLPLTLTAAPVTVSNAGYCNVSVAQQPAQLVLNPTEWTVVTLLIEATSNEEFRFRMEIASDDPDENPYILNVGGNFNDDDDDDDDDEDEDEDGEDDDFASESGGG
jgi:hypothetical protein